MQTVEILPLFVWPFVLDVKTERGKLLVYVEVIKYSGVFKKIEGFFSSV